MAWVAQRAVFIYDDPQHRNEKAPKKPQLESGAHHYLSIRQQ